MRTWKSLIHSLIHSLNFNLFSFEIWLSMLLWCYDAYIRLIKRPVFFYEKKKELKYTWNFVYLKKRREKKTLRHSHKTDYEKFLNWILSLSPSFVHISCFLFQFIYIFSTLFFFSLFLLLLLLLRIFLFLLPHYLSLRLRWMIIIC